MPLQSSGDGTIGDDDMTADHDADVASASPVRRYGLYAVLLIVGLSCAVALVLVYVLRDDGAPAMVPLAETINTVEPRSPVATLALTGEESDTSLSSVANDGSVLYLHTTNCGIADPAVETAGALRSANNFVLVLEIHAGLMEIPVLSDAAAPALVESFTVSDDGTEYEFKLKKDLKFSDGSPLTAKDVKWSWERALRAATDTGRANDVLGAIAGAVDVRDGKGDLLGVEVVDDVSLLIRLEHPRPDFLFLLADPIASVLKESNVAEWAYSWDQAGNFAAVRSMSGLSVQPVGAGPFGLTDYDPDYENPTCTLESNPHYWRGQPQLDAIVPSTALFDDYGLIRTRSIYTEAFLAEKIDYYYYGSPNGHGAEDASEDEFGKSLIREDPPRLLFLIFNPAHPPFDDVEFRRALVAGTNRDALFPYPVHTDGYIAPLSLMPETAVAKGLIFNPEMATQTFRQSKYHPAVGDHEVRFNVAGPGEFADALAAQWHGLFGLHVDAVGMGVEDYQDDADLASTAIQMVFTTLRYPDPHAVFRSFIAPFGEGNSTGDLTVLEEMVIRASRTQDAADRAFQYAAIEKYIADRALAYPLRIDEYGVTMKVQPWVHGLEFPKYGASRYRDVTFDETAPQRELP